MEKRIVQKLKRQLILFLARRLPPCKVMLPLFSEARERPLTMREKVTVKLHLFTCAACRRYVEQIERMSDMVKPNTEEETAESEVKLSAGARTRIRAALEAAAHDKN